MAVDPTLLNILACPEDKGPLLLVDDTVLYNPRLRRAYPIENGIPVLLIDEAVAVGDAEHEDYVTRGVPGWTRD
ncbi:MULTISPECIES: Trm112 family protein [unclassified Rhodococcus (in: high G+C Gram-positive bacteria)]|uniref:Trm112 family protein n=1 Tax=unclassified Rhodococcus (in: high G+C Gram-positive bacteria) TaxID=192944 RepID=UPI00146EACB0|nr:Trm112 family protein [Rhodococcus sp. (in: high G+C Gram-positive bacteria)]MBF0661266.1 Trm112 family protein [Rhodococcus sp. (in: high G+C Gram-positive bacteria)]NMD97703.1 Trm112 family protein [Rhodococcus sp. BL-253-APC-6A1W]NME80674.1 Trm112 family protein [Rhodococcus sp. 105337]